MKKVFKNTIVLVMLFTILCSNATEISSLKNIEDGKTTLFLTNVKQGEQLIIKDISGLILYKEYILKDGSYSKAFDLTELPDGNYNFELEKEISIQIIPFKVKSKTVKFNKKDKTIIYKPFVRVKEHLLYITKLALKLEPLNIKLYYENDLIYSETIENTKKIERIYRLLKDQKGVYQLVFKTEGRIFKERITL